LPFFRRKINHSLEYVCKIPGYLSVNNVCSITEVFGESYYINLLPVQFSNCLLIFNENLIKLLVFVFISCIVFCCIVGLLFFYYHFVVKIKITVILFFSCTDETARRRALYYCVVHKMDVQCDKLATVVGRTKLTTLATVDLP